MSVPSPSSDLPSDPLPPERSLWSPAFVRILVVQMAFGLSYSAFLLLPKFLRVEFDASATEIGWIAAAAVIAAALFAPLVGLVGVRFPRRLVLGVGMGAAAVAAIGFGLSEGLGPEVYGLRALQGLAWATVFNVTATMAADSVPRERLAQGIGYLGLSMLVTNALAPAVTEPLAERFGWPPVFLGAGFLVLGSFLFFPGLPAERPAEMERRTSASQVTPRILSIHYASLLMGSGIGVMFTFTQPFALARGAERVGDFFFGYVAAAALVRTVFAELADHRGPGWVAGRALALYALVVFLTTWLEPSLLIPFGVGIGISHGFLYPALTAAGLSELASHERSVFMGWFSSAFNVGFAVSVLALGPLADRFGFPIVFAMAGLWLASGVVPLVRLHQGTTVPAVKT